MPKCRLCNGIAMSGSDYCNNHIPEPVVPKFEACGELRMRNGYFEIKILSELPVELIGKSVHVVLTEREAV